MKPTIRRKVLTFRVKGTFVLRILAAGLAPGAFCSRWKVSRDRGAVIKSSPVEEVARGALLVIARSVWGGADAGAAAAAAALRPRGWYIPSFDVIVRRLRLTFDFKEAVLGSACVRYVPWGKYRYTDSLLKCSKSGAGPVPARGSISKAADDESVRWGERVGTRRVHHKDCAPRNICYFSSCH